VEYTKEILGITGISPERIQMFHCSAAEGQRFQEEVTRISQIIENLGSNPMKESISLEKEKSKTQKISK